MIRNARGVLYADVGACVGVPLGRLGCVECSVR